MSNSGYKIERLSFEYLVDMELLYEAVYNKKAEHNFFKHKYDTAFTRVMHTGYLAYDINNEPAAFYGVIPCFIDYDGEHVLAAQSADTMTHPNHRNKGLFVELARLTYELCSNEGIRLLFGFPNQNSLHGFINKLGWQSPLQLESFIFPVKALPLERMALKFPVLKGIYKAYIKNQLKDVLLSEPGITNSVISEGFNGVYRNEKYLQYRTYNTTYAIKLGHTSIWFKIQNGLVIGDIVDFEDNFENVINNLKQIACKLGLQQLHFQSFAQSKLYKLLKNYAEPSPSFPVIIKDLDSGLQLDKLAFTLADIDIF